MKLDLSRVPPEKIALYGGIGSLTLGLGLVAYYLVRAVPSTGTVVVPGGRVLSGYGNRRTGSGSTQFHLGEDIRAPKGSPIYAAKSGKILRVARDGAIGGYGNTVVIEHDGRETAALYAHMDEIAPTMVAGARVEAGQLIGKVGETNSAGGFTSSPAHLHLEILVSDGNPSRAFTSFHGGANWYPQRLDPQDWARANGVLLA